LEAEGGAAANLADVAAGRAPADLIVAGATLVDVPMGRLRRADVAIAGRRIAAVGEVGHCRGAATEVHDRSGLFLLPGLLDPHMHIGFSQVSVERLAEVLVPHGTVAVSSCLSESGSIAGLAAVEDQLDRAEGTGLDLLLSVFYACALGPMLGRFSDQDLLALLRDERCVELREWSDRCRDLPGSLAGARDEAVRLGRAIAGHLEGQAGPELQAAAALGVRSDHETTTVEGALERVRLGISVQLRHGCAGCDLERLLPAITEHGAPPELFSFCSDGEDLHQLVANGHVNALMRRAVGLGLAPLDAVTMATLGAARSMGVERDYGAVLPGRLASLALVEDLSSFRVAATYSRGRLLAEGGDYRGEVDHEPYPRAWSETVHLARPLSAADFALDLPDGSATVRAIGAADGVLATTERLETVEVAAGRLAGDHPLAKIAVADRHRGSGDVGLGLIAGLGIERGALASTINAGAFNLMTVGVDEEDMALAANRAAELGGGIVVARGGAVRAELALPLFGIVSDAPLEESAAAAVAVAAAIRDELGAPGERVVACAGFACLGAVPALRISDAGLVRVSPQGGREPTTVAA